MATSPPSLFRRVPRLLSGLARDERGSAAMELGIGAVAVLVVAAAAFDLYSLVKADTATARIAATMADYVSRETAPDGEEIEALGQFLYEQELGAPATLVYVVSAVHEPPGSDPAVTLWNDDTVRLGEAEATAALVQECKARGQAGWQTALLGTGTDRLTLQADEVVVVVEVCARLLRQGRLSSDVLNGTIYRLHALPARDTAQPPAAPVHAPPPAEQIGATSAERANTMPAVDGEAEDAPSRAAAGPERLAAMERTT